MAGSGILFDGFVFRFAACQFGPRQKTAGSPFGCLIRAVARFFARLTEKAHVASLAYALIFVMSTLEHGECPVSSGPGRRSAVEAIRDIYSPIAWLPPGHEPGPGDGMAAAARQRGRFGLGTLWFDEATSASRRRIARIAIAA